MAYGEGLKAIENEMVIGDYYPQPKTSRDPDEEYEKYRDRLDRIEQESEEKQTK